LDDDFLGRLNALLAALFALPRPRVLGAVIMSRLPITPPKRGQLGRGDRRVLAGRNHPTKVNNGTQCVPHKIEENNSGGGLAEDLPGHFDYKSQKCLIFRHLQFVG
jgi:hypothetical protein